MIVERLEFKLSLVSPFLKRYPLLVDVLKPVKDIFFEHAGFLQMLVDLPGDRCGYLGSDVSASPQLVCGGTL